MVEVISTIVLMLWVTSEKDGPRYSHCTSDSVYTDLSLNTLYLSLVSKTYNFNHAVCVVFDTLLLNKPYKEMLLPLRH